MEEDIQRVKAYFEYLSSQDPSAIDEATENLGELVRSDPIKAIEISHYILFSEDSTDKIRFHAQNLIQKCIKPTETSTKEFLRNQYRCWDSEKHDILRNSVVHGILLEYEPEVNIACQNFAYTIQLEKDGQTWSDGINFLLNIYSNPDQEYSLKQQINAAKSLNEIFELIPNIALKPEAMEVLIQFCTSINVVLESVDETGDKIILEKLLSNLIRICQSEMQNAEAVESITNISKSIIQQYASIDEVETAIFYQSFNIVFELFKAIYPVFDYIGEPIISFTAELLDAQLVLPALLDFITRLANFEKDLVMKIHRASINREKTDIEIKYATSRLLENPLVNLFELLKVGVTEDLWQIDPGQTYIFYEATLALRPLYFLYTEQVFTFLRQFIEQNITSSQWECVHAALFSLSIYNHEKYFTEYKEFIIELFPLIIELTAFEIPAIKGRAFETLLFLINNIHELFLMGSSEDGYTKVTIDVCQREVEAQCKPVLCFCCQILSEILSLYEHDEQSPHIFESIYNICTLLYGFDDSFYDSAIGPYYSVLLADLVEKDSDSTQLDYSSLYGALMDRVIAVTGKIEADISDPVETTALCNMLSPVRELVAKYHTQFDPDMLDNLMRLLIHLLEIQSTAIFSDCLITVSRLVIVMKTHVGDYIDPIMELGIAGFASQNDEIIYHTAVLTRCVFREVGRLLATRVENIFGPIAECFNDTSISPKSRGAILHALGTIFIAVPDSVDAIYEAAGDILANVIRTCPKYNTKEDTLYVYEGLAFFIIGFTKFLETCEDESLASAFYLPIRRKLSAIFKVISETVQPEDEELSTFLEMLKALATSKRCCKVVNIQLCNSSSQAIIGIALNSAKYNIKAIMVKSQIDLV